MAPTVSTAPDVPAKKVVRLILAATLLYLNNYRIPATSGVPKNSVLTNVVLVFALILFALVGASEAGLLRR